MAQIRLTLKTKRAYSNGKPLKLMVRLERFELPAFWFVARRSIQLSYSRTKRTRILGGRDLRVHTASRQL